MRKVRIENISSAQGLAMRVEVIDAYGQSTVTALNNPAQAVEVELKHGERVVISAPDGGGNPSTNGDGGPNPSKPDK